MESILRLECQGRLIGSAIGSGSLDVDLDVGVGKSGVRKLDVSSSGGSTSWSPTRLGKLCMEGVVEEDGIDGGGEW